MLNGALALILAISPMPAAAEIINDTRQEMRQPEATESPEPSPEPQPVQTPIPEPEPSFTPPVVVPRSQLPPPRVSWCESRDNYQAENPNSSASGKYQMIQSTANWVARNIGRSDLVNVPASQWPPAVQDEGAAWLWDGGSGAHHWKACL